MSNIRTIRTRLGMTQAELGAALGMTQGNVHLIEKGQTVLPAVARRLIAFAGTKGVRLSFDDVYSDAAPDTAPQADTSAGA
jgi:putative transcriptional regulator